MNAKHINASHRSLFLDGGSLLALFGSQQVTELQEETKRQRGDKPYPVCECWQCGETRPDDMEVCPTCDADPIPF